MTKSAVTYTRIREVVRAIPKGTVRTHSEIADELGTTALVVGSAIWKRGAHIGIPWWRVVPMGGLRPGGYYRKDDNMLIAHVALLLAEGVKLRIVVAGKGGRRRR